MGGAHTRLEGSARVNIGVGIAYRACGIEALVLEEHETCGGITYGLIEADARNSRIVAQSIGQNDRSLGWCDQSGYAAASKFVGVRIEIEISKSPCTFFHHRCRR